MVQDLPVCECTAPGFLDTTLLITHRYRQKCAVGSLRPRRPPVLLIGGRELRMREPVPVNKDDARVLSSSGPLAQSDGHAVCGQAIDLDIKIDEMGLLNKLGQQAGCPSEVDEQIAAS